MQVAVASQACRMRSWTHIFKKTQFIPAMPISASLFKAYDIRGVVPATLNAQVAHALGRAFGTHALMHGEHTVAVGRDGRLSGPELAKALIDGLMASGIAVIDVGMVTTPMLYFAASTLCKSGIQITGSHNPRDYNGFKMVVGGRAIFGEEIQRLRQMMQAQSWIDKPGGRVRQADVFEDYLKTIVADVRLARPMKVVIDSGNGVAGATAPTVFRALGCDVVELFSEVDGEFPNHHPDPSKPENLQDLMAALRTSGAELGLAFDGDGDRLGIVTQGGDNIFPDRQMMLFAQDVLTRHPGAPILFDVKCSQRLAPSIRESGGEPTMYKTGHSLIKARMKELHSPLGGEMSGHIFFKDRWFGFDDGTYAGCRLLEILSRSPDANAVLNALPSSHSTPELNVPCAEGEPHQVSAALQAWVQEAQTPLPCPEHHPVANTIDGVRIDWDDGFGLIRASNTTPVLVLRFEGHHAQALQRIEADMMALLRRFKPDAMVAQASH